MVEGDRRADRRAERPDEGSAAVRAAAAAEVRRRWTSTPARGHDGRSAERAIPALKDVRVEVDGSAPPIDGGCRAAEDRVPEPAGERRARDAGTRHDSRSPSQADRSLVPHRLQRSRVRAFRRRSAKRSSRRFSRPSRAAPGSGCRRRSGWSKRTTAPSPSTVRRPAAPRSASSFPRTPLRPALSSRRWEKSAVSGLLPTARPDVERRRPKTGGFPDISPPALTVLSLATSMKRSTVSLVLVGIVALAALRQTSGSSGQAATLAQAPNEAPPTDALTRLGQQTRARRGDARVSRRFRVSAEPPRTSEHQHRFADPGLLQNQFPTGHHQSKESARAVFQR